jgi:hypothetical protein
MIAAIIDSFLHSTGSTSMRIEGFEMAFGLFNFYVNDAGVSDLISMIDSSAPTTDASAPSAMVT